MLLFLRMLFSIIVMALATYGLFTKDFQFHAYMTLFLGLTFLIMGIQEIQQERKVMGWILLLIFGFSVFTSIQGFLYT